MAITINHPFVSAKGDGSDATLVRPSNWNASHDLKMASSKILGRLTAGPGLAEELPVTAFMIGLLNTADFASLAAALGLPTTGDAKLTFKVVADAGWILANDGTIGDTSSGASYVPPTYDTTALFTFFYDTFNDATAPLQTNTGAATTRAAQGTAPTAFAAHCRMVLPRQLGRALIVAGAGAGLTNRPIGTFGGEEAHTMTLSEMVAHSHTQQGTFAGSGSSAGSGTGSGSCTATGVANGNTDTVSNDHTHHIDFSSQDIDRSLDHLHNLGGTTGFMNQNNPHSHGVSGGTQGGTSTIARPQTVVGDAFVPLVTTAITINNTDINHTHNLPATTGSADRGLDHLHRILGDTGGISANHTHHLTNVPVSVNGSCSVTTISVSGSANVNTTISGQTASNGSTTPFNVMQPWTAWNVMIKL